MGNERDERKDEILEKTLFFNQRPNDSLGITREYSQENRSRKWDSTKAKEHFKDISFDGKKTYRDPISGEALHRNREAAKRKYHSKYAKHIPETDHVNSLKSLHDKLKNNPFLTDEDLKEIANNEKNFRLLSKRDNASKGAKSDWELVFGKDENMSLNGRATIAKEKVQSDTYLTYKFSERTMENMGKEFISRVGDSAMPISVMAIKNLANVVSGEENLEEYMINTGKVAGEMAIHGGANKLVIDVINFTVKNQKSEFIKKVLGNTHIGKIVTVAQIVGNTVVKYANDEIDEDKMAEYMVETTEFLLAAYIGHMLGMSIGAGISMGNPIVAGIGGCIGEVIAMAVCSEVVRAIKFNKEFDKQNNKIISLYRNAEREIREAQQRLEAIINRENEELENSIMEGLEKVIKGVANDSYEEIESGFVVIASMFNLSKEELTKDKITRENLFQGSLEEIIIE